jgi:hypothetical protein
MNFIFHFGRQHKCINNGRKTMLLREFKIEDHTIMLNQEEDTYIAQIIDKDRVKIFYHEYNDYDKIKASFDEIVQNIQSGDVDIKTILSILEKGTI